MTIFITSILIGFVLLGAGTSVFGVALAGIFGKCGISKAKAFIPYYNLLVWIKLTRNPWWFIIVLTQWYILPNTFVYGIAILALLKLVYDTNNLFVKAHGAMIKVLVPAVVLIIAHSVLPDLFAVALSDEAPTQYAIAKWIAHGINLAVVVFCLLTLLRLSKGIYVFDEERYHSKDFSFWKYARNQFRKNKAALVSVYIMGVMIFMGIFSNYIANDQPLYVKYRDKEFYPAYNTYIDPTFTDSVQLENGEWQRLQFDITSWKQLPLEEVVWAPIAYSPKSIDEYNANFKSPSDTMYYFDSGGSYVPVPSIFHHKLGTDKLGRDVASGLIHGVNISLSIGIISMGIASLIGILLGALAGFYGDRNFKAPRIKYIFAVLGVILGFFYGFMTRSYVVSEAFDKSVEAGFLQFAFNFIIMGAVIWFMAFISRFFSIGWLGKRITIPVDSIISRSIEILNSIPRLLLIITIAAVVEQRSLLLLMVIIGFTSWTGIARFTRAEFLKIRELEYVQAARSLGFKDIRVIFKHALPNALAPVFVAIAFGIASAILIESGLSFLGIGVPDDEVTWGSLLYAGREQFEAWWLVMFPGIAIFITVTVYNLIGEGLRDAIDPRLKQ